MQSAWADKLPLHPAEIAVDSYPDRLASRPAADLALRISFDVSVEDWSAPLQLILPFASLEPYKERFRPPRRRVEDDAHASEWEAHLRRELLNVPVEISGVLATQEISLKRLLQLRAGSVLELQKPGRVAVCAGGEPVGMGDYGAYQGKKAIKVLGMALSVERRNDS